MNLSVRSIFTITVTFLMCSAATVLTGENYDESLYKALKYRNIGPFRGGRSAAVAGIPGNDRVAYFGGTGGGVWETKSGVSPSIKRAVSIGLRR